MTDVSEKPSSQFRRPSRSALQSIRRLGWGVCDQGISSLSNFALGLIVARSFGATEFGAFTLAYLTYSFVLNAARGVATDPLLVRHSGEATPQWRRASSKAAGTALTVGVAAGLICVVAGLLIPAPVGPAFVALGVALPGLALQDSWRFVFFACGRGSQAFLNDLVWTIMLVGALLFMLYADTGSAANCLLAFGATASLASILGAVQARTFPRVLQVRTWLRANRDLSARYLVENVANSGAPQLRSYVLGAVAGLAAVGYVRASEILMGPFLVVLMGLSQVAVPEASRVFHRNAARLSKFCLLLGGIQAVGALIWGVIIWTVFPLGIGYALLKDVWGPTVELIPPVTLIVVAASFITAATAGLRAMGLARRTLRTQLIASSMYAIAGSVGAVLGGALGSSWGVVIAQSLSACLWWYQLSSALAAHRSAAEVVSS